MAFADHGPQIGIGRARITDLESARTLRKSAEELIRKVRRRYPSQGSDSGARRRALGWLARRGVRSDDARRILEEAAGGD